MNQYINITSDIIDENIEMIRDLQWWINNCLQIWKILAQRLVCIMRVNGGLIIDCFCIQKLPIIFLPRNVYPCL
jgi:hypothetical protein